MSESSSSFSHAAASASDGGQAASDRNHSPTMMMNQPPEHAGPPVQVQVQPDPNLHAGPYVPVHRYDVPEGYPHHVMPYVGSPAPPSAHQGHPAENVYPSQQTEIQEDDGSPSTSALNRNGDESRASVNGKRKQPDSASPDTMTGKRRRQRAMAGEEGEEVLEGDVGPNGGAKHWTEEEKTRFFNWMLTSDEHWDAFKTRMNVVFREASAELFPGRKSFTALKSCYHRNLDVFKQVHAFQAFSANHHRHIQAENPSAGQPSIEAMLEAARVAGLNVGSLSVKVIDRWYETGWFDLFKKRYREDPKTGLPAPYHGPADQSVEPSSSASHGMMGLHATIDPQLVANHPVHPNTSEMPYSGDGSQQAYAYSPPPTQQSDYRQPGPSSGHSSFQYLRSFNSISSISGRTLASPTSARASKAPVTNGQRHSPLPDQSVGDPCSGDNGTQVAQALTRLTVVTESLLGVCSSLNELLQQQIEESKARAELMRSQADSGEALQRGVKDKITFATEILRNGPQNDEVKKAAVECLTKYLL